MGHIRYWSLLLHLRSLRRPAGERKRGGRKKRVYVLSGDNLLGLAVFLPAHLPHSRAVELRGEWGKGRKGASH